MQEAHRSLSTLLHMHKLHCMSGLCCVVLCRCAMRKVHRSLSTLLLRLHDSSCDCSVAVPCVPHVVLCYASL
jgi:hypothetical protein